MMTDCFTFKKNIRESFDKYVSDYDISDDRVALKVEHTYRVADISEDIGKTIHGLTDDDIELCWFLGMLHDIGRFEQLKQYGTFLDAESVDHAELGADILFNDKLIDTFITDSVSDMEKNAERHLVEVAIRNHNKLFISDGLSEKEKMFSNILRDADKIDIFRVVTEIPFEVRMTKADDVNGKPARDEVMQCVREHRCVPRLSDKTSFESHIAGCAMAFELVFPRSIDIAREQGYIRELLSYEPGNDAQKEQMDELRNEMSSFIE